MIHPFDAAAATYDADFTERRLAVWLRQMVRAHVPFRAGERVLELGCGTGEDARWLSERGVHVTATDASAEMLALTRAKALDVTVQQLDMNALPPPGDMQYDGVFSNFGALNCVEDLPALAAWLAPQVRGKLVFVVMGRWCPWEIGWHLAHLQPRTAFRRMGAGGIPAQVGDGVTVRVWYPSPHELRRAFAPHFRTVQTVGIGTLLPPSYLDHLVERWPGTFARFAAWDRRFGKSWLMRTFNDHYLMVLAR